MRYNSDHALSIHDTEPSPNQLLYEWKPGQSRYYTVRLSIVYVIKKIWYELKDGYSGCFVAMAKDNRDQTFKYYLPEKDLQILINCGTTNPELTAKILGMKKDWLYEMLLYINRFLRSFA